MDSVMGLVSAMDRLDRRPAIHARFLVNAGLVSVPVDVPVTMPANAARAHVLPPPDPSGYHEWPLVRITSVEDTRP
jgi:hypothetical protein